MGLHQPRDQGRGAACAHHLAPQPRSESLPVSRGPGARQADAPARLPRGRPALVGDQACALLRGRDVRSLAADGRRGATRRRPSRGRRIARGTGDDERVPTGRIRRGSATRRVGREPLRGASARLSLRCPRGPGRCERGCERRRGVVALQRPARGEEAAAQRVAPAPSRGAAGRLDGLDARHAHDPRAPSAREGPFLPAFQSPYRLPARTHAG